jgi:23S rRNA G2069 N7-methylase RlmK/C1962 C5-methylase RlmI
MWFLLYTHVCRSYSVTRSYMSTSSFPKVVCKRTRQSRSFREGNPLVFSGAIAYTQSTEKEELPLGCLVSVHVQMDKEGKKEGREYPHMTTEVGDNTQLIGWGVYNPHSMYRVRILCHATNYPSLMKFLANYKEEGEVLRSILETLLKSSLATRRALNLPSSDTDTYRLVNGEGDGLSGLAVDIIGGSVAVVMSSAAWCQVHKSVIEEILQSQLNLDIIWKTTPGRLQQDGMELVEDSHENNEDTTMVVATESGIQYATFPYMRGQKTGVYCDQRENRYQLAQYCGGKRVLDLCCYHGGFSLNAAIHGRAQQCTGVDSSQDAIDISKANSERNKCNNVEFVRQDISQFMKQAYEEGGEYDVIVLDPPKLAPSISGLYRASRKYHGLNRDAIKLMNKKEGGLLLTCTCSAAMTQQDGLFLQTIQQAAIAAGRRITLLRVCGAASCHTQNPASKGSYLTAALFHVSPM